MEYKKWQCVLCGLIYDEEKGLPDEGITVTGERDLALSRAFFAEKFGLLVNT